MGFLHSFLLPLVCPFLSLARSFFPFSFPSIHLSVSQSAGVHSVNRSVGQSVEFRPRVVLPTVCSPTSEVDSPTSNMSARLPLKLCTMTIIDSPTWCAISQSVNLICTWFGEFKQRLLSRVLYLRLWAPFLERVIFSHTHTHRFRTRNIHTPVYLC